MCKNVFLIIVCIWSLDLFSQNNFKEQTELIVSDSIISDSIKKDTSSFLSLTVKLKEANKIIENQNTQLSKLHEIEKKLDKSRKENSDLRKELETADKRTKSAENNLIVLATNFLYIPYEAYGVEKIAIKAFEIIQDSSLKQEHSQAYFLLKNYQNHLKEFKEYLQRVQKECNGVFQATAIEFIDSTDPSIDSSLILTRQQFYQDYIKYNGFQNTFIGGLIQKTQEILRSHTKQKRANMHIVLETIDKTQSTVKIDNMSKVIGIIDESLKTVELL